MDDATNFLLGLVTGVDKQKQANDAAILRLTNLASGRDDNELPAEDQDAVDRLTALAQGK